MSERDRPEQELISLGRRDERRDRLADPRLDAGSDHRRERLEAQPRVLEPADDHIGQIERVAKPLAQPVIGLRQAVLEPRLEVQRLEQLVRDSVAHDGLDGLVLDDRGDDRHEPVGLEHGPIDPEPDDGPRDGDAHEDDEHPRGDSAPRAPDLDWSRDVMSFALDASMSSAMFARRMKSPAAIAATINASSRKFTRMMTVATSASSRAHVTSSPTTPPRRIDSMRKNTPITPTAMAMPNSRRQHQHGDQDDEHEPHADRGPRFEHPSAPSGSGSCRHRDPPQMRPAAAAARHSQPRQLRRRGRPAAARSPRAPAEGRSAPTGAALARRAATEFGPIRRPRTRRLRRPPPRARVRARGSPPCSSDCRRSTASALSRSSAVVMRGRRLEVELGERDRVRPRHAHASITVEHRSGRSILALERVLDRHPPQPAVAVDPGLGLVHDHRAPVRSSPGPMLTPSPRAKSTKAIDSMLASPPPRRPLIMREKAFAIRWMVDGRRTGCSARYSPGRK